MEKSLHTSTLAFDIAQFFSSLNHHLLPLSLDKTGFDSRISIFFFNYIVNKQTQYIWNSFISPFFRADIGMSQGSAFSPILSILYIVLIFHIFKNRTKNFLSSISVSILSFIDNSLFVSQEKSYKKSNANLFCSYSIISSILGLKTKYNKLEVFYFSRLMKNYKLPLLDFYHKTYSACISTTSGPIFTN